MRLLQSVILAWALSCGAAIAQPSRIVIEANPHPIVAAEINGHAVRLLVDPAIPDVMALNTATAERLGVRNLAMARARVSMDGAGLSGRAARPDVRFANGETERLTVLIFSVPVTDLADGVIGPGALPYRIVTMQLGPDAPNAVDLVFRPDDPDLWNAPARVSPTREVQLGFMLLRPYTMLNRAAAGLLQADRALTPVGALEPQEFLLGLTSLMQPVTVDPEVNAQGLAFRTTLARTEAPIIGAEEDDAIFVVAESDQAPVPRVMLGREALGACSSLSMDRRARRLTLRCAPQS